MLRNYEALNRKDLCCSFAILTEIIFVNGTTFRRLVSPHMKDIKHA